MPGLEPGTSRLSMLVSALTICPTFPLTRARTLYSGLDVADFPGLHKFYADKVVKKGIDLII